MAQGAQGQPALCLVRSCRVAHTGRQTSLQGQERPRCCCAGAWREAGAHREHCCLPPVTHTSWPTFLVPNQARHSPLREHLFNNALALRALASSRRAGYHHMQRRAGSLRRSVPLWHKLRRTPQASSRQRHASAQQANRRRGTARGARQLLRRSRAAAARRSRLSCSAVRSGLQGSCRLSCKAKEVAEPGPAYCQRVASEEAHSPCWGCSKGKAGSGVGACWRLCANSGHGWSAKHCAIGSRTVHFANKSVWQRLRSMGVNPTGVVQLYVKTIITHSNAFVQHAFATQSQGT